MSLSQRRRYLRLKEAGICLYCHVNKVHVEKGRAYAYCAVCRAKIKSKSKTYADKPYKRNSLVKDKGVNND